MVLDGFMAIFLLGFCHRFERLLFFGFTINT